MSEQTAISSPGAFRKNEVSGLQRFIRSSIKFARVSPVGAVCAVLAILLVIVGVLGETIAPYDPYESVTAPLLSPSWDHPFGTDELGRDVMSRIIAGTRNTVLASFSSLILGTLVGVAVGIITGYFGSWIDMIFQRIIDALMAFPFFLLLIMVVAVLGNSLTNVIIALSVAVMPTVARIVRSSVLSEKERQYIEASRAIGASQTRVVLRHLLPNIVPIAIVLMSVNLGQIVISEASLSFLGLGAQPPSPSWGRMLSGASRTYMIQAPHLAIFAGLAVAIVVLIFNLLGDALRDWLDPKLRSR